jgi:cell division FtsZ-interacting protein ZapD
LFVLQKLEKSAKIFSSVQSSVFFSNVFELIFTKFEVKISNKALQQQLVLEKMTSDENVSTKLKLLRIF